jgi:hypothetical protein
MTFKWEVTPGQAFEEMFDQYTNAIFVTGGRVITKRAADMKAWMQLNAPWTDRTGRARRSLDAVAEQNPGTVGQITVMHGPDVPYGLWLEIANGGRYAIIAPTIDHWGPVIMRDIQRIINLGLISAGDIE